MDYIIGYWEVPLKYSLGAIECLIFWVMLENNLELFTCDAYIEFE